MAAPPLKFVQGEERLIAIIGDEDTVTGFLLAGIGESSKGKEPNYFVVTKTTPLVEIEEIVSKFLARSDLGAILICQHVANDVRHVLAEHKAALPCVLEIPSKDVPYDSHKDDVLQKINRGLGIRD